MKQSSIFFNVNKFEYETKINIIYGDAYHNLNKVTKYKFDLILIDLTESLPNNVTVNKLPFLTKCKDILDMNGILVMNGKSNELKLNTIFKFVKTYGCYLKTFEEYYEFVICSDAVNFEIVEPKRKRKHWKDVETKFYNFKKHREYFNWYSLFNREHI